VSAATRDAELAGRDAEARRLARSEFERPLVLEAGAGTGKTTALVTRVLAWCLGPGWERNAARVGERGELEPEAVARQVLKRIVAITFTEAAAAEMGSRLAEALRAVEAGELPGWLPEEVQGGDVAEARRRASALRGAIDLLVVQTIHAYCRRLLVTHPLEARLHPHLEIDAEGVLQEEVVRAVLEEQLAGAYGAEGAPTYLALAQRGIGPARLEEELLALLEAGVTARQLTEDPLAPARLAALHARARAALAAFAEAGGGALAGATRSPIAVRVAALLDQVGERLGEASWPEAAALGELASWLAGEWTKKERDRLRSWARGGFGANEATVLGSSAPTVAVACRALEPVLRHLARLDPELLATARAVLGELLGEVELRLRARGIATFSALLEEARRLLTEQPGVAARVRGGIDQLLVDEFQDTDDRQCDILRALALSGPRESRPGLFLVGDPKQSIYGWRSADLEAYDGFVKDVTREGGMPPVPLAVNFRSVPVVLEEVERVVEPKMEAREGVQPPFQRLLACPAMAGEPGFARGRLAPVEYWASVRWDPVEQEPRRTLSGDATRLEAAALAHDLRALHDAHGVAWKDVGVLFRSRGDLEVYLGALRDAGVPYAVEGDRSYYQRREVIEAAALLRSVLDPNDGVALLAWLRSAAVGVPDAAWIPLFARGLPGGAAALEAESTQALTELRQQLAEVAAGLPEVPGLDRIRGWEESLLAALVALVRLRESLRSDPADVFVERLRALTLIEVTEAARHLGAWRAANLDRFFRDLAAQLDEGASPHALLRRLRRSVGEEEQHEEGRPRDAVEDAVRVMTIHGAKGLDFEHVYLMQLHKGSGGGGSGPVAGPVGGSVEYRLLGAPTPGFDLLELRRETVGEAERLRTLYVAMTRAKRRLVLAGLWTELQGGGRRGQTTELFDARWEEPPDLDAFMRELAAQGADHRDEAGARWFFPALARPEEKGARKGRAPAGSGLPSEAQAAAWAEALREAGAQARAREARPLGGAASAAAHEERLDERAERRFGEPAPRRGERSPDGATARAVGTAIHRVLEEFDLEADPAAELARRRASLETLLAGEDEALEEACRLLDRLAGGTLLAKLRGLAGEILHRELPVLLPAREDTGPTAYLAGVIDLVYRSPETGELVIADYKTDRVEGPAEADARAAAYRGQGAAYQRALRDGLGLSYTPRFELWFLRADEIRS
jgi:ATP-dependent helicase/nuclease subunit A